MGAKIFPLQLLWHEQIAAFEVDAHGGKRLL
jgi:hypothetical protein